MISDKNIIKKIVIKKISTKNYKFEKNYKINYFKKIPKLIINNGKKEKEDSRTRDKYKTEI